MSNNLSGHGTNLRRSRFAALSARKVHCAMELEVQGEFCREEEWRRLHRLTRMKDMPRQDGKARPGRDCKHGDGWGMAAFFAD